MMGVGDLGEMMRENGRRRWRKWLARQRKHRESPDGGGKEPWCWWRSPDGTGVARRHCGSAMVDGLWNVEDGENHLGELPDLKVIPAPARSFTQRSLVGMTQGARKRAARVVTLSGHSRLGELGSTASGVKPSRRRYSLRLFHRDYQKWTPFAKSHYLADREPFRIGEGLRPCKGCLRCCI